MNQMDERMGAFERRLESVGSDIHDLRGEVGEMRGEVGELRTEVGGLNQKFDGLSGEVSRLRVLYEDHTEKIGLLSEAQAAHGRQLEEHGQILREMRDELRPIRDLRDFVARVAGDHEKRIRTLENDTGSG